GHRGVAEGWAVVADVEAVVELLVVVEGWAGGPGVVVRGGGGDGGPAGPVGGVAGGGPAAGGQPGQPGFGGWPPRPPPGGGGGAAAVGRGGEPGAVRGPAGVSQRGGALAQDGVDAGGEGRALNGDLPVAFDEGDDDVLAAQSGEQVRGGDAGFGVGGVDGLLE